MKKIFILQNVEYSYARGSLEIPALRGIDLAVEEGDFVALLGPNGSGKTTLAYLLNALLAPRRGQVISCGYSTDRKDKIIEIRRQVGLVMQNPDSQIVGPTVEDDIAFGLENLGMNRERMVSIVSEVMERLQLTHLAGKEPHLLSQGEKQRLALAGVLAMGPRAIISDEATSYLDPEGKRSVLDYFVQLNQEQGLTLVHITHRLEEALMARRVLVLRQGDLVFDGSPRNLLREKELLVQMGWELPPLVRLADSLRGKGVPVPEGVLSPGELVQAICP